MKVRFLSVGFIKEKNIHVSCSLGGKSGNPPIFVNDWYNEPPQPPVWDPI